MFVAIMILTELVSIISVAITSAVLQKYKLEQTEPVRLRLYYVGHILGTKRKLFVITLLHYPRYFFHTLSTSSEMHPQDNNDVLLFNVISGISLY